MDQHSYVYMMGSASRRALYTGVTAQLRKRAFEHKHDLIEGFTSKYKCHRLVYFERFSNISYAIAREKEIKGWRREKKNKLVESMIPHGRIWQPIGSATSFSSMAHRSISKKPNTRSLGPTSALMKALAQRPSG